jgi:hypothetical protein
MSRIKLMTLACAAALTAAAAAAGSTPPGRLAKGTTASGRPVIASASATIRRPSALYGRAIGRVNNATFIISCKHGSSRSSKYLDRQRAGTWRLPMMLRPDSCRVDASVAGSGRIRVEIRYKR